MTGEASAPGAGSTAREPARVVLAAVAVADRAFSHEDRVPSMYLDYWTRVERRVRSRRR